MSLLTDDPAATAPPPRPGSGHRTSIPIWHGLAALPPGRERCVAALGVFDGIHRGHAALLRRAVELGDERGLSVVMVTFDPHPARVVGAPRDTSTLSSLPQRADWAGELGVDAVAVLPFTDDLAALSPAQFIETVLVVALSADAVVVGANFTFGARAAGTPATLAELGEPHGFSTHPLELLPVADTTCSSTHIRTCLHHGDVAAAARALGRPHQVDTRVHVGVLTVDEHAALPAPGCYRARFITDGGGDRPAHTDGWVTVDDARRLHSDQSLRVRPGGRVLVSFLDRSRP